MIGITVQLPKDFFKIVDSAAISVFESGEGDLKISPKKGVSVQLKKNFSQKMSAQISTLINENPETKQLEKRGSLGFVFQNKDGSQKIWAEGFVKDQTLGLQAGASQEWGPGTIVLQAETIRDQATDLTMAYNLPIGSHFVLSPEIRWRKGLSENFNDETMIAIRAHIEAEVKIKHSLLKGRRRK